MCACDVTQANWHVASGALSADAASLHPAVDQSFSDACLHDIQRLSVSSGDGRRCSRILLFRLDSTSWRALRCRHVSLTTVLCRRINPSHVFNLVNNEMHSMIQEQRYENRTRRVFKSRIVYEN